MAVESVFQRNLIKELKKEYEGAIILKNDPTYLQGIPDIVILNHTKWAMLECKKSESAKHRPNQDYWIERINGMSAFAAFVYPENKEEVLHELRLYFARSV